MTTRHPAPLARALISCAVLAAASLPAFAQTAATAESPQATSNQEQAVKMSSFVVRTTQGSGYSEGNAATALKSDTSMMDLAQNIIVVSSDMIKDIGQTNSSDILQYAGVGTFYRGPAIQIRGSRVGNPYVDDVPLSLPAGVADNVNIDSYEVIRGPVQVFYPSASLGGAVLESSKRPLPGVNQFIITAAVNQYGGNRDTFDFNTPIGKLGDGQLTARIVGAYQTPNQIFINVPEQHEMLYPDLEWDWNQTTVILSYDVQLMFYLPGGTSILTPTGGLYTGWGRRFEGAPPNDQDRDEQHDIRFKWIQKLSDSWQVQFQACYENFLRYGIAAYPGTVNWQTNTIGYVERLDDSFSDITSVIGDVKGHYEIGGIAMESLAGFTHQDGNTAPSVFPTLTVPTPISQAAVNALVLPNAIPITIPETRSESYTDEIYVQQTADVVPNWLTLGACFTFAKSEAISDTNIALVNPYPATDLNGHDLLHRLSALVHITKDVSLYAMEATSFSGSAGVTYLNTPLPLVQGKDDEIGLKTAFLDGKISTSISFYKMALSNQAIIAQFPALNIVGANYYIPIGTTHYAGWDGDVSLNPIPGLQIIAAANKGSVVDQNDQPITQTYGNQWSVWLRYDFDHDSPLRGFSYAGGVVRQGAKYFSMASLTPTNGPIPAGTPYAGLYTNTANATGVALFKLHEGTMVNMNLIYDVNRHLELLVNCENVLDQAYPEGAQGVGLVDPSDPRTFTFQMTYKF